ncbi:MAG: hypothetical protein ACR2N3_10330 [Pyrinomonadaceae bacterium]
MKKENRKLNGSGSKSETINREFDFGESKIAESLIKMLTLTRQRLYPERYDNRGRLKKNGQNSL